VSGRLEKESLLCKLLRAVIATTPSELGTIVYLASVNVAPAYEGLELGIGESLLLKAVCEATGRTMTAVKEDLDKQGDLGEVALLSRNSQKTLSFAMKPKPLQAIEVLEALRTITRTKGDKAQARKVVIIKGVMVKCQGSEAKYIIRALQGKGLRIGKCESNLN
jgi:DNA ligase-1